MTAVDRPHLPAMPEIPILAQTASYVICVKPCGVLSESTPEGNGLPELLAAQLSLPHIYPIHRLDATTGGVMVYAVTKSAAAALSEQLSSHRVSKTYLALCEGMPEPACGAMEDELFFDRRRKQSFVVDRPRNGTKSARLTYRVLAERTIADQRCALCEVTPETGRTHQIRVQFASRRHPLLGDKKYGARIPYHGLSLWCRAISFADPTTGAQMTWSADMPVE